MNGLIAENCAILWANQKYFTKSSKCRKLKMNLFLYLQQQDLLGIHSFEYLHYYTIGNCRNVGDPIEALTFYCTVQWQS